MSKKHMVFNTIFSRFFHGFGFRKRFQNRGFFDTFSQITIFWKLIKTIEKPMVFNDFSWFDSPKNDPKLMPKCTRKKHRKTTTWKSILASVLASQNRPKSLLKPPKSLLQAMLNEACFATLWKSPGSRRKPTGVATSGLRNWLCIWLGLLYLSIYWSAPRRPNHQSKVCNLTWSTHISAHTTRKSKNIVQRH